jgi:mRNA-decapping enzyme subunit 2
MFGQQRVRLYIIAGVKDDTAFAPLTKKEISVCGFLFIFI